ncbi:MAG: hypothetical protein AAFO99_02620 [Bacteroidota bacterium]
MTSEKITLKKSPPLEFIFNEDSFQIINEADPDSEGIYQYGKVRLARFKKEKTNWVVTILSFLGDLFFSVGHTDIYKERKRLTIKHDKKSIELNLLDCEQSTIDILIAKINSKLCSKTST